MDITIFIGCPDNYPGFSKFIRETEGLILVIGCSHSFSSEGGDLKSQVPPSKGSVRWLEIPCTDLSFQRGKFLEVINDPKAAYWGDDSRS